MSVIFENQCVGCPPEMGCLGSACPNRNVEIFICDECGDETDPDKLYVTDDEKMLCSWCLLKKFKTVAKERGW